MAKEEKKQVESKESDAPATADAQAAQPDPFALSIGDKESLNDTRCSLKERGLWCR